MKDHRHDYPVKIMARVLQISRSGFYAWLRRQPSGRATRLAQLTHAITERFIESRRNYGSRKIAAELDAQGSVRACRNTVARLMRKAGLRSRTQRRRFVTTTDSDHDDPIAANHLDRQFTADRPNEKWVADITYIPTRTGWVYLAAVMDLYSRRIVGWHLSRRIDAALVQEALKNALALRHPEQALLHHSDRGCQYTSEEYRKLLKQHDIQCSMSRRGNCWDNAVMERFFCSLKTECVNHEDYRSLDDVRQDVFKYIEIFYNRLRRHEALGYISPDEFEAVQAKPKVA